jgi:hypothetical protein
MEGYPKLRVVDEFTSAREEFVHLVGRLSAEETAHMEHGPLEELIASDGNEILRRLLQGHLDRRSREERRHAGVLGADGVERRSCREDCERQLESRFGTVLVHRKGYEASTVFSVFPLDAELNLPLDKYSHGLRHVIADEVARNSFDESVATTSKMTGGKVPKRQAEELAARAAQDFNAFYASRRLSGLEDTQDALVMSIDAKGIVMRKEDLREATRRAAERKPGPKLQKRLGAGEKRNRKRMATVGAIYSLAPYERTAEDVMGGLRSSDTRAQPPRAQNKRVFASVADEPEEVVEELFQEAFRRDPECRRVWVMLLDGDEHQIKRVVACAKRHRVDVIIIQDFIHVLEYLWKAAYCFYDAGTEEAQDWVTERGLRILEGHSSYVAAGMRRSATLQGLTAKEREAVDVCAGYLIKDRSRLRFDVALAMGLPIATGVIEGACRHLVKDRMDVTGARWSLEGAEAVLRLRSLRSSGDFTEYWRFHQAKELERNHRARYADLDKLLKAA